VSSCGMNAVLFALYGFVSKFVFLGSISASSGPVPRSTTWCSSATALALIPDQLQGRVNSAFRSLAFGFNPLGAAVSGWLLSMRARRWP